jgi:hypothetical protein
LCNKNLLFMILRLRPHEQLEFASNHYALKGKLLVAYEVLDDQALFQFAKTGDGKILNDLPIVNIECLGYILTGRRNRSAHFSIVPTA